MTGSQMSAEALDKIIDIAERNRAMQGEFIKRFETSDRDHREMIEIAKNIIQNSYDIVNMMKMASNEKIINILAEESKKTTAMYTEFCVMCSKVTEIADADKWVKRLIAIITAVLIAIQSIGLYMHSSKADPSKLENDVKMIMRKLEHIKLDNEH